jgi:hypothetical protein
MGLDTGREQERHLRPIIGDVLREIVQRKQGRDNLQLFLFGSRLPCFLTRLKGKEQDKHHCEAKKFCFSHINGSCRNRFSREAGFRPLPDLFRA